MELLDFKSGLALFLLLGLGLFSSAFAQSADGHNGSTPRGTPRPQQLEAIRTGGFANLKAGNWEAAHTAFEKALSIEPKDGQSLYGSALALFNLRQVPEADARLEVLFSAVRPGKETDQLLADSLVLSAVISAVEKRVSDAITKLQKATGLIPIHFDAHFALGRACFESGDIEQAALAFRRAADIRPDHHQARFFLATTLERSGRSAEALKEYREILRRNKNSAEGNLGFGILLLKTEGDRSAEGLAALQRAVALDEKVYEGQTELGKVLIRLGRPQEAVVHLQKAARLAPDNPEPHFQLAIAYRKLNRRSDADAETAIVKEIHERRRGVSHRDPQ